VWHYKATIFWNVTSVEELLEASRLGVNAARLADLQVLSFRPGRLAHVQGMPVGALKHGGDPHLAAEPLAQGLPTGLDLLLTQWSADDLHELVEPGS